MAYTHRVGMDDTNGWEDSEAFDITQGAERVEHPRTPYLPLVLLSFPDFKPRVHLTNLLIIQFPLNATGSVEIIFDCGSSRRHCSGVQVKYFAVIRPRF